MACEGAGVPFAAPRRFVGRLKARQRPSPLDLRGSGPAWRPPWRHGSPSCPRYVACHRRPYGVAPRGALLFCEIEHRVKMRGVWSRNYLEGVSRSLPPTPRGRARRRRGPPHGSTWPISPREIDIVRGDPPRQQQPQQDYRGRRTPCRAQRREVRSSTPRRRAAAVGVRPIWARALRYWAAVIGLPRGGDRGRAAIRPWQSARSRSPSIRFGDLKLIPTIESARQGSTRAIHHSLRAIIGERARWRSTAKQPRGCQRRSQPQTDW